MTRRVIGLVMSLFLVVAAAALVAAPQDRVQLVRKAKVGDTSRYASEGVLSIEANGTPMAMQMKETEKVVCTAVGGDGSLTFESTSENRELTMNGASMPVPDTNTTSTVVIRPDGSLVSHKSASGATGADDLDARMYNATNPVFPDKPVGVGDTWTREFKSDAAVGTQAAKAEFKVVAFEKVDGIDAVKISMTFKETTSTVATTATVWIERATGDQVKVEAEFQGVPLPQMGTMGGTIKQTRIAAGR